MRVENPRFDSTGIVFCEDCPFDDVEVSDISDLCLDERCPREDTYTAACLMAEEAAKGGKG
jgi:hypothetical protein